jgi:hypothetical protein
LDAHSTRIGTERGLDTAGCDLTKLAKGNNPTAVRFDFARRSPRIRHVLVLVRDIEEIERIERPGHGSLTGQVEKRARAGV